MIIEQVSIINEDQNFLGQPKIFTLTKPAVREGADCPRDWFLIRTRFDASPVDCQVTCPTLLCTLLDKGSSCLPTNKWQKSFM